MNNLILKATKDELCLFYSPLLNIIVTLCHCVYFEVHCVFFRLLVRLLGQKSYLSAATAKRVEKHLITIFICYFYFCAKARPAESAVI